MTHISREQLIAFAANELESTEAEEVAARLVANPEAARTVDLYRTAAITTRDEDTCSAPADLVARAKAIFRVEAPARRGLAERLQDVIAHLVYDSRLQPAATRATAAADRIQLSFEAGDCEIDLRAEPVAGGSSAGALPTSRWRVVGQVLSDGEPGPVTVTVVTTDGAPVTEVRSDDRALFTLEVAPGCYDLRIVTADEVLVLSGVEIG